MAWIDKDLAESKRQQQSAAVLSTRNSEIAGRAEKGFTTIFGGKS